jgi:hypothetical protein
MWARLEKNDSTPSQKEEKSANGTTLLARLRISPALPAPS